MVKYDKDITVITTLIALFCLNFEVTPFLKPPGLAKPKPNKITKRYTQYVYY